MIEQSLNSTNVIWSFNSSGLDRDLIQHIASSDANAVRLVAADRDYKSMLQNAGKLKAAFVSGGRTVPIMVDAVRKSRGKISNLDEHRELLPDDKLTLTPSGCGGDLEIDGSDWKDFFKDDTNVYLGNGLAALKPESIEPEKVTATVVQGGVIPPGVEVHCPLTRKPPVFADLDVDEIRCYGENCVDAVVVQGFATAKEMSLLRKELRNHSDSPPWLVMKVDSLHAYEHLEQFMPHIKGC